MPTVTPAETIYQLYLQHPNVCTDTRKLQPKDLFVALRGANFNGNNYALQALQQGAAAAIVDEASLANTPGCYYVQDSLRTLQALANHHRKELGVTVVGVTGTNGKTTTKELLLAVLQQRFKVLATEGNLNNHIGVPLTLLKLTPQHQIAVVEMGASAVGDIQELAEIAEPNIAVVTNVGKGHLCSFGSVENILQTKSELPQYTIAHGGTFFLNADDPLLWERWGNCNPYTYGCGNKAQLQGKVLECNPYLHFSCTTPNGETTQVHTRLVGSYNIYNALAAMAVGMHLGLDMATATQGIQSYTPTNNRSQYLQKDGKAYILDCYNANPTGMRAAIATLVVTPAKHRFALLGDMLELGNYSMEEHCNVCKQLSNNRDALTQVWLCGEHFTQAIKQLGWSTEQLPFLLFSNVQQMREHLAKHPLPNESVTLIKGSHSVGLQALLTDI